LIIFSVIDCLGRTIIGPQILAHSENSDFVIKGSNYFGFKEDAICMSDEAPGFCLAATLLKVGDFIGAKNSVEKALEIDKTYVKAWAKKGDIEFFMKGFLFYYF
jgi:hypothetical protein